MSSKKLVVLLTDVLKGNFEDFETEISKDILCRSSPNQVPVIPEQHHAARPSKKRKMRGRQPPRNRIKEESADESDENYKGEKIDFLNGMDGLKSDKRGREAPTLCPLRLHNRIRVVNNRTNYSEDLESFEDIADAEEAETLGKIPREKSKEESDESYEAIQGEESEEDSDESYEAVEDDDSDESYTVSKVRIAKSKMKKSKKESHENYKEKNAYEQMVEKNRQEKLAFLKSLQINEAKTDFLNAVSRSKPAPQKRKPKTQAQPTVLRKSDRLQNCRIDYKEEDLLSKLYAETPQKKGLPYLSFKDALGNEDWYEYYMEDINIQRSNSEAKFLTYSKSDLEKMSLNEPITAKVTPNGNCALAWYPSPEQLIVAGGDNCGNLGILNLNNESDAYAMKIHHNRITNLQFSPFNQEQLISSSADGIICCSDMIKHTFDEIYNVSDTTCCTNFEFLSATTLLIAQENGQVAVVDKRDKRNKRRNVEMRHRCSNCRINSVSVHPVRENYFISAGVKGSVDLWDLRMLQKSPVQALDLKRFVRSAFFSPVAGNSILTTGPEKIVRIFDSSNLNTSFKLKSSSRSLNKHHLISNAIWLPKSEDTLIFGSTKPGYTAVVYDKHLQVYHNMTHKHLIPQICTQAFHPTRLALACGKWNNSGSISVFTWLQANQN